MSDAPSDARRARRLTTLAAALLVGAIAAAPLAAQQTVALSVDRAAVIQGRVVDESGEPLAGAEVRLTGPSPRLLRADEDGRWQAAGLAAGRYTVRARLVGRLASETTLDLVPGATAERSIALAPAVLPLGEIVVTGARREQRLADAVVATELLSRVEIAETGASNLASVLTERAGIELQGGHPAGAGVMLQGIGSERVLVLVDGQPVAGRIAGVFDVSRIPVAAVERVEIVKGPQSTLYGSEAMGGVINIITRSPEMDHLGAHAVLLAGTQSRVDGTAGASAGRGSLAGSVDVGRRSIENAPGRDDEIGALAQRTDLAARARWTPGTSLAVDAGLLALDERQRWLAGDLYQFADNRQWTGRLGATWQRGAHRVAPTLSASSFDHLARASRAPKPIAGVPGDRQVQRVFEAELLYNVALGAHALDVGIEGKRDDIESANVPGGRRSLDGIESFAQLELASGDFALLPGVRVSWNEQWGSNTTPRLSARWRATDRVTLRASAGMGFRAPDFKELYMQFLNDGANYSVTGNPELRPERSRNVTAGAEWTSGRVYARGQLFWNEFRDFIETRTLNPDAPPEELRRFRYENVDDGRTRGAELETGVIAGPARLEAAYSLLETEDRSTGRQLLGRPTHAARATLRSELPLGLRGTTTAVYTGRTPMQRDETSGAITGWREPFARLDARVARALPGGLELAIGADNLFDVRPDEWAGFTGRHVYTSLSFTLDRAFARGTP